MVLPANAYLDNLPAMKGIAKRHSRGGGNPERAVQCGKTVLCSRLRGNDDVKRASRRNGTLYIGVTSNLVQRVWNHKQGLAEGFTSKYSVKMLVYFEPHETAESAITREKQLKKWERAWKMRLIEESDPAWRDLYSTICI